MARQKQEVEPAGSVGLIRQGPAAGAASLEVHPEDLPHHLGQADGAVGPVAVLLRR
jgi:hypothetical protein